MERWNNVWYIWALVSGFCQHASGAYFIWGFIPSFRPIWWKHQQLQNAKSSHSYLLRPHTRSHSHFFAGSIPEEQHTRWIRAEAGGVDTAFLLCLPSRFHSFNLRCKALNSIQLTLAEWSRVCGCLTKPSVRHVILAENGRKCSGGARVAGCESLQTCYCDFAKSV